MADNTPSIQVYIENARDESIGGFTIPLPTTREALTPWLTAIEADMNDPGSIAIREVRSGVDNLATILRYETARGVSLDELNYLAERLSGFNINDMDIFLAALDADRHCGNIAELINLSESLDRFDLQPAFSAEQYGAFLLETEKDNTSAAFERLEKSEDPEDRALAAYILDLEEHIDPEYYGRHARDNEQCVFTNEGYLTERGGFREIYRGPADIPREYRLFAPEPALLAVRKVELMPFLLKLHAVAGEYTRDAKQSLETLGALHSSEYLLLLDGKSAYLTGASHAYRQGSDAFEHWMNTTLSPDTQAFAIHLTEVHGEIRGDVERIDFGDRQMDILAHSIRPVKIEAEMDNGETRSYTPQEWESLSLLEMDHVQSWRREFQTEDYTKVRKHLDEIGGLPESAKATGEEAFFTALNAAYMEKSQYPTEDFLRVPRETAKEMLARGDADVFRLLPAGAEKLSPIDAVKSGLWFSEYREFAIKREDLPGLDKWAERTAAAMISRAAERAEPKKSQEPEL